MKRTITVPGAGRVSVEPDVASLRLGVNIQRDTASAAREDAARTMSAILDAVVGQGVARRDVRTALVSLNPVMDYGSDTGPRLVGYQVMNTVNITVRALDQAGRVIDTALAAGASTLDSLEFSLADPRPAQEQARAAAVEDARARAETIAAAAGVALGAMVAATEAERVAGGPPLPFARAAAMEAKADTPVEGGAQDIEVSLVVTFALGK